MDLKKLRQRTQNRHLAGTEIPRQDRTSSFFRKALKKAGNTPYAGVSGEVEGTSARPRLDRPARRAGGPVVGRATGGRVQDHEDRIETTEPDNAREAKGKEFTKDSFEQRPTEKFGLNWRKGGKVRHRATGGKVKAPETGHGQDACRVSNTDQEKINRARKHAASGWEHVAGKPHAEAGDEHESPGRPRLRRAAGGMVKGEEKEEKKESKKEEKAEKKEGKEEAKKAKPKRAEGGPDPDADMGPKNPGEPTDEKSGDYLRGESHKSAKEATGHRIAGGLNNAAQLVTAIAGKGSIPSTLQSAGHGMLAGSQWDEAAKSQKRADQYGHEATDFAKSAADRIVHTVPNEAHGGTIPSEMHIHHHHHFHDGGTGMMGALRGESAGGVTDDVLGAKPRDDVDPSVRGRSEGGPLTAERRNNLPGKDFAGPDRSYPIEDPNHARNALSRVSQNGSPEEKAEVRAKVHKKYPEIGEE